DDLAAECYEVLLAWAEAEAPPERGQGAPGEPGTRRALHLLDVADALAAAYRQPRPRAFHLRRARYLALAGGAAPARAEPAPPPCPFAARPRCVRPAGFRGGSGGVWAGAA